MPILPDVTQVRRQTPRGSRAVVSPSVATAGQGLQSIASGLGDLARGIDRAETQKAQSRDKLELSKARSEWRKARTIENAAYDQDEDYSTFEERYRGSLSGKSGEITAAISNPETRELFQNEISGDIEAGAVSVRNLAFRKESDFETARLTEDLADLRGIALEGDTEEAITLANERINATLDSGFINQNQAVNIRQKNNSDYAVSRVKLAPPVQRIGLLNGALGKYIDKDIQKQLLKGASQEYSRGLDDYVSYLSAGNEPDPELEAKFSSGNVNAIMGDRAGKVNNAISDAKQFGSTLNSVKTAGPDEIKNLLQSSAPSGPEDFKRESSQFNMLQKAIQQRNKQISNDPAQYVNANFSEVNGAYSEFVEAYQSQDPDTLSNAAIAYADAQREAQEELGLSYAAVQVLPKQIEDSIAGRLNDFTQGGEAPALFLDSLKTSFGSEWPTVQRQLQSNKALGSTITVMSGMDFGEEVIALGEANAIGQKAYKDIIGNDNHKAVRDDVGEKLEDFQKTLQGQPGGDIAYIQHKTSIETLAMKYIADGKFDDVDDALEQSIDDVIGKRFEFVDTYRVPKRYDVVAVEEGVDTAIDAIASGEYDLMIPDSANVQNVEDKKEVFLSVLRPSPITSPDGDGILFIDQNGKAILQSDGQPLVVPWDELQQSTDESLFEGLFESGSLGL